MGHRAKRTRPYALGSRPEGAERSEVRRQRTDDRRKKVVERDSIFMVFLLDSEFWLLTSCF
jgi:hypothetical protein